MNAGLRTLAVQSASSVLMKSWIIVAVTAKVGFVFTSPFLTDLKDPTYLWFTCSVVLDYSLPSHI